MSGGCSDSVAYVLPPYFYMHLSDHCLPSSHAERRLLLGIIKFCLRPEKPLSEKAFGSKLELGLVISNVEGVASVSLSKLRFADFF